jgi:hypothetical protein
VELSAEGSSNSSTPADIQVTVNGVASAKHSVTVNSPASLRRFIKPGEDTSDPNYGYISYINYKILDRFGKLLFGTVPVIEHFTGPVIKDSDFPNPQWPRGPEKGGAAVEPFLFWDTISGCPAGLAVCTRPVPLAPHQPYRDHKKVNHFDGEIAVGSAVPTGALKPARGVVVERLVWQRFQDHARHCNIASPPSVTPTKGCPGLR